MNKFKLVLGFNMAEGSPEYNTATALMEWLAVHYADEMPYEHCAKLNTEIVIEMPFIVWLDDEEWIGVDRTSQDTHILLVVMEQAILTDDVLESLPSPEIDRIEAACWAVHNNEWAVQLMPLATFDNLYRS